MKFFLLYERGMLRRAASSTRSLHGAWSLAATSRLAGKSAVTCGEHKGQRFQGGSQAVGAMVHLLVNVAVDLDDGG